MQPSSFLDNIAQQPEFLSAASRSNIESRMNCATPKRLSSLIKEQYFLTTLSMLTQPFKNADWLNLKRAAQSENYYLQAITDLYRSNKTPYLTTNFTRFVLWKKPLLININERLHNSSKIARLLLIMWSKSLWVVFGNFHTRHKPERQAVQKVSTLLPVRCQSSHSKILLQ